MTSADFCRTLVRQISLGTLDRPSTRAVRLYRHSVVDCWASSSLADSPAMVGLAACSCSYGRVFAFGPFAPNPHGSDLAYSFS